MNSGSEVEKVIEILGRVEKQPAPPFFTERALQRIFNKEDIVEDWLPWWTPKIQWGVLLMIVIVNATIMYSSIEKYQYKTEITQLADFYNTSGF